MQKYITTYALNRAKTALSMDKHFKPEKFSNIIKSELYNVLAEYADIKFDDFEVNVQVNEFGEYMINIVALARRLKIVGIVPDKL